jgi:hypothetical protein
MGRGMRNHPVRERKRGAEAGDGSPVPRQEEAPGADGEKIRYHVSVPLGMWEARTRARALLVTCCAGADARRAARS